MPLPPPTGEGRRLPQLNLIRLAWLAPVTAILIALRRPTQDNSYLWHIQAGLRQIDLGSVLTKDPFSFTAGGRPWRTQSWLIELVYGWFERIRPLASADVVVGVAALILLGAVGLRLGKERGLMGPVGVLWVMWLTLGYFTARPVFASLALLAVLTLIVDRRHLRWTIPLLFWVWASVHGGFVVGLGYMVLQGLRRGDRRLYQDAAVGAVAATLTAHGWGVWEILLSFAHSSSNLDLILEWLPPDFVSIALIPFLVGIVGLLVLALRQKMTNRDLFVVIPFLVFAFTANRAVSLAAIALVAFLFPRNQIRLGRASLAQPVAWSVVALMAVLPFLVNVEPDSFEQHFPVAAARHLEPVRTFHDDSAGGYLIYQGFPYIFVDDRAELYGDVFKEFVDTRAGRPGWEEVFQKYDLQQALLNPDDPLVSLLRGGRLDRNLQRRGVRGAPTAPRLRRAIPGQFPAENPLAVEEKAWLTLGPMRFTATKAIMAIRAMIRAYSTMLAPRSLSRIQAVMTVNMLGGSFCVCQGIGGSRWDSMGPLDHPAEANMTGDSKYGRGRHCRPLPMLVGWLSVGAERAGDGREGLRGLLADQADGNQGDDGDQHDQQGVLHHAGATLVAAGEPRGHLGPDCKHVSSFRDLRWRACVRANHRNTQGNLERWQWGGRPIRVNGEFVVPCTH